MFFIDSVQACKSPIYVPEITIYVTQLKYIYHIPELSVCGACI